MLLAHHLGECVTALAFWSEAQGHERCLEERFGVCIDQIEVEELCASPTYARAVNGCYEDFRVAMESDKDQKSPSLELEATYTSPSLLPAWISSSIVGPPSSGDCRTLPAQ